MAVIGKRTDNSGVAEVNPEFDAGIVVGNAVPVRQVDGIA
jgi:hypothetical protein